MRLSLYMAIILPFFTISSVPEFIGALPVPEGFQRRNAVSGSYAAYIRQLRLKKDSTVYLFNGQLKSNQRAQFAVLTIPVKDNPLLQCADAVYLIRANWLFEQAFYQQLRFLASDGTWLSYSDWCKGVRYRLNGQRLSVAPSMAAPARLNSRDNFHRFMQVVYTYCGTASLARQLKPKSDPATMEIGDVFLKAGFPGHVMMVADLVYNKKGEKLFILLQGYMPAQDIHVVKAIGSGFAQPWQSYTGGNLQTPEWRFAEGCLYGW